MKDNKLRICKKCLIDDIDMHEYFNTIEDYINSLPKDIRTDQEEYEKRLDICAVCEKMVNGMCMACGCFVEVRASKKDMDCPWKVDKW